MAAYSNLQPFAGSARPRHPTSKLIEPVDPNETVSVMLLVRARPGAPPLPTFSDWQKTPPAKRKFLSVDDYVKQYGATDGDMRTVTDFLTASGLSITESHGGRRHVTATGTAAQVNAAFGVELKRYESPVAQS